MYSLYAYNFPVYTPVHRLTHITSSNKLKSKQFDKFVDASHKVRDDCVCCVASSSFWYTNDVLCIKISLDISKYHLIYQISIDTEWTRYQGTWYLWNCRIVSRRYIYDMISCWCSINWYIDTVSIDTVSIDIDISISTLAQAYERPYPTFAHQAFQNHHALVSTVIQLCSRPWLGKCEVSVCRATGCNRTDLRAAWRRDRSRAGPESC
jgi:hypothetical protein